MGKETQLIVALDVDTLVQAETLVESIGPAVEWYKIGKQLFTRYGPETVDFLRARGKRTFLDLKFHDIPNTVAQAVSAAAHIGADMVNVHASGGLPMLHAAKKAAAGNGIIILGVTVLTSLDSGELARVGITNPPEKQVELLAGLCLEAGFDGVVCSPLEIAKLKSSFGDDLELVVPGIRPAGSATGDQKRTMSPREASAAGADFIVVGRPITGAPVPSQAAAAILGEIQ